MKIGGLQVEIFNSGDIPDTGFLAGVSMCQKENWISQAKQLWGVQSERLTSWLLLFLWASGQALGEPISCVPAGFKASHDSYRTGYKVLLVWGEASWLRCKAIVSQSGVSSGLPVGGGSVLAILGCSVHQWVQLLLAYKLISFGRALTDDEQ